MEIGTYIVYLICYFGLFTTVFFLITLFENGGKIKSPNAKRFPKTSIIVPAFNEEKTLFKTISSLIRLDYPKDKLELIVVDDGSTDNTLKIAKQFISKGVKVYTKKNGGKGETLNFGIKKATGEIIGCLDADSFVGRKSLKKMVAFFEDSKVMAVTPSLKVYKPKNILQRIQMVEYLIGIFLRKVFAFLGSIHVTPGPFSIYRKTFFEKHGNYDENNLTEDIEIALRIQSNGYFIENSVDAPVYTMAPYKFNSLLRQRVRWYTGFTENVIRYRQLFSKRHGNLGVFILPGSFFAVILVIVSMYYFFTKTIKGVIQHFTNFSAIGFDIFNNINIKLSMFYLNISPTLTLVLLSLLAGIAVVIVAKKISKEKKSNLTISYIPYLALYWFMFGFFWIATGFLKIFKKRLSW